MKKNVILILTIAIGLAVATMLSRAIDARRTANPKEYAEEPLYVSGPTAKRLSLGFNGLASDWYWMRSLQYVGGKIVAYEDEHEGRVDFGRLSSLNLQLLPQLLQASTALDPQFMAPYEYGAMVLPELDSNLAIELLNHGIEQNPSVWRLYHHLGYIYWQRHDYAKASEIYAVGAKMPGAPAWMSAMSARMKGEGGSRDAAREMYRHLSETSPDEGIRQMVLKQIMRLDSLDERDAIQKVLSDFKEKSGRCASSWRDVGEGLRAARLRLEVGTWAPVDPSDTP